jgi:NTE family protein
VSIGGRLYIDGGVRSSDNADLAAGSAQIVVLSPLGYDPPFPSPMPLRDVVGRLRSEGSAVTVITPDEASAAAMGINLLTGPSGSRWPGLCRRCRDPPIRRRG